MNFEGTLIIALVTAAVTGALGFFLGRFKEFRESKQEIYYTIIPTIVEMCFRPKADKEREYNSAILSSWLYANKRVAGQIDKIASILIDPVRGDIKDELQILIVEMRKDIQPFFWQNLKVEEIKHIYTKFIDGI